MSLQFSDTTNKRGIIQLIDFYAKSNSVSYPITEKTRDVNLALDDVFAMIFSSAGTWQFDDGNHTDYPTITTNLVQGQRDYTFTTDEQGNMILHVYKVMVKNPDGIYYEVFPVDTESSYGMDSFFDGVNVQGVPLSYNKTANGIQFNVLPSYNSTAGVKIFINREASYFTTTDTTKKPGFAGLFHEYLALKPAYKYAFVNTIDDRDELFKNMQIMEKNIKEYYRDRSKDEQPAFSGVPINSV